MLMQLSHSLYTRCSSAPGAMLMSSPPPLSEWCCRIRSCCGSSATAALCSNLPHMAALQVGAEHTTVYTCVQHSEPTTCGMWCFRARLLSQMVFGTGDMVLPGPGGAGHGFCWPLDMLICRLRSNMLLQLAA